MLYLLDLFVDRVSVTVRAEFFDLEPPGGITTVFASGIARNAVGTLVGIGATFGAFDGDRDADAFFACHNFLQD
jgi:hypothetical protein